MNKVILIGRLTKNPDLKFTEGKGTAVTTITIAVDKYNTQTKKNEADFISVVVWGKQAENVATYLTKGSQLAVCGRLQTRTYEDKDSNKRYITEVVAQEVVFLSKAANDNKEVVFDEDIVEVVEGDMPF